jgi:hypothetical protein
MVMVAAWAAAAAASQTSAMREASRVFFVMVRSPGLLK